MSNPSLKLTALAALLCLSPLKATAEQEGRGTDAVEALFYDAQKQISATLDKIQLDQLEALNLKPEFKTWLKGGPEGQPRLAKLQYYTRKMTLKFQEAPCWEPEGPRGACYDNSAPESPRMIVSYSFNHNTGSETAQAMLIHEAGHLVGEKDHLFLSDMGTDIVRVRFPVPPPPPTPAQKLKLGKFKNRAFGCVLNIDGVSEGGNTIYASWMDWAGVGRGCAHYYSGSFTVSGENGNHYDGRRYRGYTPRETMFVDMWVISPDKIQVSVRAYLDNNGGIRPVNLTFEYEE